jgi:hypothetical protein
MYVLEFLQRVRVRGLSHLCLNNRSSSLLGVHETAAIKRCRRVYGNGERDRQTQGLAISMTGHNVFFASGGAGVQHGIDDSNKTLHICRSISGKLSCDRQYRNNDGRWVFLTERVVERRGGSEVAERGLADKKACKSARVDLATSTAAQR